MSNKTLSLIIIILILVFAGGVAFFRYQSSKQDNELKSSADGYTQNNKDTNMENKTVDATPTLAASATPTPEVSKVAGAATGQCVRNFDENKLKNDKVAIANRQVEIQVKNFGSIKLELYDKDAPKTVENFLRLANSGYYDCLTFHRIGKEFMIQGGDPTGSGAGGESAFGSAFADELNPNTPSYKTGYKKGVLAMANAGPNTNGSQFFILVADYPLDHAYTIFGQVIAGQDVADKISQQETLNGGVGAPLVPVVMSSVKIIK